MGATVAAYPVVNGLCAHCGRTPNIWTPQSIIAALQAWTEKHGRPPTADQWRKATIVNPAHKTVHSMFGSFEAARRAAGVTLIRKNHAGTWTREQVIDAITRWVFVHGRIPRRTNWQVGTDDHPTVHRVESLFGTWNGAIVAAGYEPLRAKRSKQSYRASMSAVTKAAA